MHCFNCQKTFSWFNIIRLIIDGHYKCQECDLDLNASTRSFGWFSLLIEVILLPLVIILSLIFTEIWFLIFIVSIIIIFLMGIINYKSAKKQYLNKKKQTTGSGIHYLNNTDMKDQH